MSRIRSFYKEQHMMDCRAVELTDKGDWDTPWFLTDKTIWADKNGGKRGSTYRYLVACCNDTQCPAVKYVDANDVEAAIR